MTLRAALVVAAVLAIACKDPVAPIGPPAKIRPVTATIITAVAGSNVPGGVTVHVIDFLDRNVSGAKVAFSITAGDGTLASRLVQTDANGNAHTEWTLGQTAGTNTVLASIFGVDSTASFTATGTPGPAVGLAVTPATLRLTTTQNSGTVSAVVVDQYGNPVAGSATYVSRNPSVVTVNSATGAVSVISRGGSTYVIATGSGFIDSSKVVALSATDPPCTGITAMANLAVGEVITTGFAGNGICVPQTATGGEYAFVPYFDSSVPNAQTVVNLTAFGSRLPGALGSLRPRTELVVSSATDARRVAERGIRPDGLHDRLRATEAREIPARAAMARRWYAEQNAPGRRALRTMAVPAIGDLMQLNVNSTDYCASPAMRTGRVAAITSKAVVVADQANPAGFTDPEYASFGATFDTLVYATDIANFGTPTDIDNNGGRIVLFFTHAVNEIGPGVLGYYYGRDLLPKQGPLGLCPGSNVAEIMYLLVPDPSYSKSFVLSSTVATAAHEFQHLINGARRLYINPNAAPSEERWLNEGLSHIAEELLFYRATKLAPRQNLGAQVFTAQYQQQYVDYQSNNFGRLREYLRNPETQGPVGFTDDDDDLPTRGAIWSFLRYAADQRFAANETAFWQGLTNSNSTGMTNLYEIIGADTRTLMRNWALSIFLDDLPLVTTDVKYRQPSWNLRQVVTNYSPATQTLQNNATVSTILRAGGNAFARFGVNPGQEVYVSATGGAGTALPRNILLALVRTK